MGMIMSCTQGNIGTGHQWNHMTWECVFMVSMGNVGTEILFFQSSKEALDVPLRHVIVVIWYSERRGVVGERGVEMELFPQLLIRSWGVGIGHSSSPNSLEVVADVVYCSKLVSVTLILVRFPMEIHPVIQLSPLIAKQTRLCEWPTFAVSWLSNSNTEEPSVPWLQPWLVSQFRSPCSHLHPRE